MEKRFQIDSQSRWWDIPAILLLVVIMTTAYSRLVATEWTESLIITRTIVYLGLIAGLALGISRFSPRKASTFALAYGLFVVPWRLGLLMGEGILWTERLTSLAGRLGSIFSQLAKRQAVSDNLLFLVLMSILFWVLGTHAAYSLVRYGKPWRVILPTGMALVIIHSYDAYLISRVWYLVIFLFFALLFVARVTFINQRRKWMDTNTYIPPYIGVDFIRIALIASTLLLLLSWVFPADASSLPAAQEAWHRIRQPLNEFRNTMDNAFASLRSSVGIVSDYYGPSLALGRGNRLSDALVATVLTPAEPPDGIRFYWRQRVYDVYNRGWTSALLTTQVIEPNDFNLAFADMSDNLPDEYNFTFTVGIPLATLLTPHQTTWISRPAKVEMGVNEDNFIDLATVRATPPLNAGESYNVRASFNSVSITALREAGTDYPEWVTERYLSLPPEITDRTRELALQIAEGEETPYDVVDAVTNYLRTNIDYVETVASIPSNQDPVDWFLFDYQQGFCNYYATAEVVLLRTLGIPARMAVGYSQGERMADTPDAFVIRQRDAHAWPEVYFPGIGWVEFEPTVAQPLLLRPLGSPSAFGGPSTSANFPEDDIPPPLNLPLDRGEIEDAGNINLGDAVTPTTVVTFSVIVVLLISIVILLTPYMRRKRIYERFPRIPIVLEYSMRRFGLKPPKFLIRWSKLAQLSPLGRAYQEINLALSRLGSPLGLTETPTERAESLQTILPPTTEPAQLLLSEYQSAIYGRSNHSNLEAARQAGIEIRNLSYRELLDRFMARLRELYDGSRREQRW